MGIKPPFNRTVALAALLVACGSSGSTGDANSAGGTASGAGGSVAGSGGTSNNAGGSGGSVSLGGSGGSTPGAESWSQVLVAMNASAPVGAGVAVDAKGDAWATWIQSNGTRNEVHARFYDANADHWSDDQVIDGGTGDAVAPVDPLDVSMSLAISPAGAVAVVWRDHDVSSAYTEGRLRVARLAAGSTSWSTAEPISGPHATSGRVAVTDDGNAVASWVEGALQVRSFTGGTWGEIVTLEGSPVLDGGTSAPVPVAGALMIGTDGKATALWHTSAGLWAARGAGPTWTPAASLSLANRGVSMSAIGALPSGGLLATWIEYDGLTRVVYYATYADGPGWAAAKKLENRPDSIEMFSLAVPPSGHGVVAFETAIDLQIGSGHIYTTVFDGAAWSDPKKVDFSTGRAPRVGIDDAGSMTLLYDDYRIYSMRSTDGMSWTQAKAIELPNQDSPYIAGQWPELAVAPNGIAVALWADSQSAGKSLYAEVRR